MGVAPVSVDVHGRLVRTGLEPDQHDLLTRQTSCNISPRIQCDQQRIDWIFTEMLDENRR